MTNDELSDNKMSIKSVSFFASSARNIEELANRLYIGENVSDFVMLESVKTWFNDPRTTSNDLATYLSKEKNREKILVLLEFLGRRSFVMNYEHAYMEVYRAKNLEALVELTRAGVSPPDNDTLIIGNSSEYRDMVRIQFNKDINLEAKHRNPMVKLQRVPRYLALRQALFILGYSGPEQDMDYYFNLAIQAKNKRAFFYLLHSNFGFSIERIIVDLIDDKNVEFIKEMCRQGYRFDMIVEEGLTAIEYAVGRIPDKEFDCFFFKAGRLNYAIPEDAVIMNRLIETMEDSSVIQKQKEMPKLNDIPIYDLDFANFPRHTHTMEPVSQRTRAPKFDKQYEISDKPFEKMYDKEGKLIRNNLYQVIIDDDGEKKYVLLTAKGVSFSSLLNDLYDEVEETDENGEPVVLQLDIIDKNAFVIVMAFIRSLESDEESNCDNGAPLWITNLIGGLGLSMLFRVCDVALYLGVAKIFSALAHFMNKSAEGMTIEQLRYLITNTTNIVENVKANYTSVSFKSLTHRHLGGVGPGDI